MPEVKPSNHPLHEAWMHSQYLKACQEGIHVSPRGYAMIESGVKVPDMQRILELHAIAVEIGAAECDMISNRTHMQKMRKAVHASRRLSYIAIGLAVFSLLISTSTIL